MGKVSDAIGDTYAIDAAGNPVALQPHQQQAAHEAGYTPVGKQYAQELQKAQENKDYVDEHYGTAGKAALGGLGGLTLGLGPAALVSAGLMDRGHLEAAQQSGAYTAGDVAGMLLPAVLSGGASAEARVGGSLTKSLIGRALEATPAGLLGRAGGAAEALAGRFLPEAGILGKLATPTIQMAARGATEGAIVNLAHDTSDAIIQNKPLAAQSLLASGVNGALFGGLTGGILGGASALAGAGVDLVGGRVASTLGGAGVEGKAGTALGRLGATEADLRTLAQREGDVVTPLRAYGSILQDGNASFASDTSTIARVARETEKKSMAIARDAVETLQREHPAILDGRLQKVTDRIRTDIQASFGGTVEFSQANRIAQRLEKDLEALKGTTHTEAVAGSKIGFYGSAEPTLETVTKNTPASWNDWVKSRTQLVDRVERTQGLQQQVYKTALNAFDDELRGAMERASPELAEQFGSAITKQRFAGQMLEFTGKRAAFENARPGLHLNGADAATLGYSLLAGANPLVGGGIIAGKKIVQHVQQRLEPAIAEAAYRSAIGANAAHAQVAIGQRVSSTLKTFITGGRLAAEQGHARQFSDSKLSYSMKNYTNSLEMADQLTSAAHQAKVKEVSDALVQAGHPELAQEIALTYGRAVAYINQNRPKKGEQSMGNLSKSPKAVALDTKGMRFLRITHAIMSPMDAVIGGLERGDISRDAVAAAKYVLPDWHADVVSRASNEILAAKEAGVFVPADRVAMLGVVLDAAVDTKLDKGFIAEVQAGLAANNKPTQKPNSGGGEPPVTDVSQYQTPLQSTV